MYVFMIWECTLSASMRVQEASFELRPSAAGVPGSGMLGMVVWMVRFEGS